MIWQSLNNTNSFYDPFFLIKRYFCESWNIFVATKILLKIGIFTVQNYGDRIMQTTRYNLECRKLTFYGITRPQSIRKSKQISGQTILSRGHFGA